MTILELVVGEVGYRAAPDRTAQRHVRYDRNRTARKHVRYDRDRTAQRHLRYDRVV